MTYKSIDVDAVNAERKHLETLLQNRVNFHLLFASVFIAGLANLNDPTVRLAALVAISFISVFLAFAVLRSYLLVQQALKEIRKEDTPYGRYCKARRARLVPNANHFLLAVPICLTIAFVLATVFYWRSYPGSKSSTVSAAQSCIIYEIDDRSGHWTSTPMSQTAAKRPGTNKK